MATKRVKKRAPNKAAQPSGPRALHYKVVELSSVDEHALERTLNEWSVQGWTFDGVQFAMRDSSKRPSMAFIFFTREGAPLVEASIVPHLETYRDEREAERHLKRLSTQDPRQTAWDRLHVMAKAKEPGDE